MIVIEIKDFEVYKPSGRNYVYLFATLWDEGDTDMNSQILAEYEIKIEDSYSDYKITKKTYNEKLTIKETRDCDDYIEKLYDACYFEDEYVEAYNEPDDEELSWFI